MGRSKSIFNYLVLSTILVLAIGLVQGCGPSQPDYVASERKMVIYQVFTRLFGSDSSNPTVGGTLEQNGTGKFEDFTSRGLDSIKAMGMTHIWYTGVIEHASIYSVDTVGGIQMNHPGVIKGKAGSPYAIKDYYDVNAYMATDPSCRMEEFEALVQRSHNSGLKVIIDFVPNHVARGYHSDAAPKGVEDFGLKDNSNLAFSPNNNFYYLPGKKLNPQFPTDITCQQVSAGTTTSTSSTTSDPSNSSEQSCFCEHYQEFPAKVTGNDVFSAEPQIHDWYETVKLNYGVDYSNDRATHFDPIPDTWLKMRDILLFWADKKVDGFRCDMAEMVPKEFWAWVVQQVKAQHPDIVFIAEIYNPKAYEAYIHEGGFDYLYDKVGLYDTLKSVVQGHSTVAAITQTRKNVAHVQPYMLNFLENHDEQRIAWHEFVGNPRAGIAMTAISALSDNIPFMLYFGQELGEESPDATGFGGADGRTTIFDFWTYPLYQAWRNSGKFDGAGLTPEQKQLRRDYVELLALAQKEIFIKGEFIDLSASNPSSHERVYAFARLLQRPSEESHDHPEHSDHNDHSECSNDHRECSANEECDEETHCSEVAIVVTNLSAEEVQTSYVLPEEWRDKVEANISGEGVLSLKLTPYEVKIINIDL